MEAAKANILLSHGMPAALLRLPVLHQVCPEGFFASLCLSEPFACCCSRLHQDGCEQSLPRSNPTAEVQLCGKMQMLDRILVRLHQAKHKVRMRLMTRTAIRRRLKHCIGYLFPTPSCCTWLKKMKPAKMPT